MDKKARALAQIRKVLATPEYKDHLFSEKKLADRLNMSRTPVRDALAVLAADGLIEQIPQVGIRVREFSDQDLREIFMIREAIEVLAAKELAGCSQNIRNRAVKTLTRLTTDMENYAKEGRTTDFLRRDTEFHWRIAQFANLPSMQEILKKVGDKIQIIGFVSTPGEKTMLIAVEEHKEILRNVAEGSEFGAQSAAHMHLRETCKRLEAGYGHPIFNSS